MDCNNLVDVNNHKQYVATDDQYHWLKNVPKQVKFLLKVNLRLVCCYLVCKIEHKSDFYIISAVVIEGKKISCRSETRKKINILDWSNDKPMKVILRLWKENRFFISTWLIFVSFVCLPCFRIKLLIYDSETQ